MIRMALAAVAETGRSASKSARDDSDAPSAGDDRRRTLVRDEVLVTFPLANDG